MDIGDGVHKKPTKSTIYSKLVLVGFFFRGEEEELRDNKDKEERVVRVAATDKHVMYSFNKTF